MKMQNDLSKRVRDLLCQSWCDEIDVAQDGDTLRLCLPLLEHDGDYVTVWLRHTAHGWQLEDGGTTLMRVSYESDAAALVSGPRRGMLDTMLTQFGARLADDGQIIAHSDEHGLVAALLRFGQALVRVSDLERLTCGANPTFNSTYTRNAFASKNMRTA
jgi:hypothetical protein